MFSRTPKLAQLLFGIGIVAIALPLVRAQQTSPSEAPYVATMIFDVVSIHEAQRTSPMTVGGGFQGNTNTLNMTNIPVEWLLQRGFGINSYQISGTPEWARDAIFNVQAKTDSSTDEKLANLTKEQINLEHQHMVQVLLTERFKLKTHWESKDLPTLALVVEKKSPGLRETTGEPPSADELKQFGDHPIPPLYQRGNGRPGYQFIGHGASMKDLAALLGSMMNTTGSDKTGLTGKYDFTIQYQGTRETNRGDSQDPNAWPPLEDAIEDQIGLKFEHTRSPTPILVIDHIEKPSEN